MYIENNNKHLTKKLSIVLLLFAFGMIMFQNLLQAQTKVETPEQALERELKEYEKQLYNFDNVNNIQTLKGHSKDINSIAFSPDGQYIASGSFDETVKIWKRSGNSFSLLQTLKGHSDWVNSVVFSPDGQYLASGSDDKTVKIWKRSGNSFSLLQTLKGHSGQVKSVAFSSDGQYIASVNLDKTVKIWKWSGNSFSLLQTLKGHSRWVISVAFSSDGQYLASGDDGETVKIWKWSGNSFSLLQTLKGHSNEINSVAFSPDGQYIASGSDDKTVKIWKRSGNSFSLLQTLKGHSGQVKSVAFSPNGQYIASGGWGTVEMWKRAGNSFSLKQTLKGHSGQVKSVVFSPDGQYIASGSFDNTIRIYTSGKLAKIYHQNKKEMNNAIAQIQNLLNSKDEFETEQEYKVRIEKGEKERKAIEKKYKLLFKEELKAFHEEMALFKRKKEAFVQSKIRKSREEAVLYIENVGQYNPEKEIISITINSVTENIKIPRLSARSFKENWRSAKVRGVKQLAKDLETYDYFNLAITHPIIGDKYPFGEQRAFDGISSGQYVYITATLDNIRKKPNGTIIKKCRKGETYLYLGKENGWFKLKLDNGSVAYTHQTNGELKLDASQSIAVVPPEFKISAKLKEPSGNGFLDAEEKGEIVVTVANTGKGAAFGLIFDLRADKNDPALTYSQTRIPGEIQPGQSKTVTFDVSADKSIKRDLRVFTITALESNGFNPDLVKISFETYPLQLAELSLVDFGVNTASGDNVIVPGEVVDIKARVQNIGEGKAKDIKFNINPPVNVFFAPGSKQNFNFSELDIGEFVDFEFSILTNKQVQDEVVISIGAAEKYAQKSFSLPLEINKPLQSVQEFVVKGKERQKVKIQNVATFTIDIAKDIPRTNADKKDAFAVVIGNRDYLKVQNVDYAINDAILMKEYLIKSLGYRDENIFFIKNATKADFELYFGTKGTHKGRLYNSVRPDGQSEVFIYYSGHGSPDIETGKGYFVPVDADPMYVSLSGFPTDLLYENLVKVPTKNVTIVLDACFSGSGLLKNISPVRIKFDNIVANVKNSVVFSSSTGDQVSSWYPEKQHGMFTYFFLKGIHNKNADSNRDGKVTYNELFKFVTNRNEGVPRYARQLHNVEQMPTFWGDKEQVFVEY